MGVEEILRKHGLSADGLQQSKSGFTNALFLTEDAVVKIFTEPGGAGFQKESWFYGNIAPLLCAEAAGGRGGLPGSGTDKRKRPVSRMEAYDGCEEGGYGPLHYGNQQGTEPDCAPGRDALV